MQLKESKKHSIFPYVSNLRRHKVIFVLFLLILYTSFIFLLGGVAYKDGIFGRVIEPLVKENIRIPLNYIRSLSAHPEHISLDIKHKDFQKLAYKRELALAEGVLHSSSKDFVPAKIRWDGKTVKVDVRLKGDLADHWSYKRKWSFRIKTKGNETILGMKEFSLQHPRTRGFLNDWYLHQLLNYIGGFAVLRYEFIELTVNGKDLGIYLLEEHFDSMLLENNKFVKAPIIRIYDHLLWYNVDPITGFTMAHLDEHYTLSPIDAFNTGTVNRDQTLLMNFNQAKNLLESFRQGKLSTHQVFNVQKLAKLFAVIDLLGYQHSTAYSNIRFYYNPIISRLEPIGYDNTFIKEARSLCGQATRLQVLSSGRPQYIDYDEYQIWYKTFFADEVFFRAYIHELGKISDIYFLDDFFKKTDKEYQEKLNILHKTFPGYRFKYKPLLYKNQEYIRRQLDPLQGLNAYFNHFDSNNNLVIFELGNIQSLPIEILNASYKGHTLTTVAEKIILHPKARFQFVDYSEVKFQLPEGLIWTDEITTDLMIKYRVLGTKDIKSVPVYQWSHLDDDFLKTDFIRQKPSYKDFPFLSVDRFQNRIIVKSGCWEIDQDLIIPKGFTVHCGPGTELNLTTRAKILSYSQLSFMGTKENPIKISSKDGAGQGIVIIGAEKKTVLQNVIFQGLSSPSQADWQLSGAVTFYESPIVMYQCQFRNTMSRHALNIIRSEFTIKNSFFTKTDNSAVSIFFGKGKISDSSFFDCGKDAILFSGSRVEAENIFIKNTSGRGLAVRKNSQINLRNIEIHNTNVAVEAIDMSTVSINNISIHDCKLGFAVFQKRPEFGPSKVRVVGFDKKRVKLDYLLGQNSMLSINGKYMEQSKNIDKLRRAKSTGAFDWN